MGDFNCERKAGNLSIWFGCFPCREDFYRYIRTIYCADFEEYEEDDFEPICYLERQKFEDALEMVFRPEYESRPEEAYYHKVFDWHFNRFQYDFGVTFDEDFCIVGSCEYPTCDVSEILDEWQSELKLVKKLFPEGKSETPYNCFIAIPSFRYLGAVKRIELEDGVVEYIGCIQEHALSSKLAEHEVGEL